MLLRFLLIFFKLFYIVIKLTLLIEISLIFVDDCPPSIWQGMDAVAIADGNSGVSIRKNDEGRIRVPLDYRIVFLPKSDLAMGTNGSQLGKVLVNRVVGNHFPS